MTPNRARLVLAAALSLALGALGCSSDDDDPRNADGRVTEAADISVYDLRPGDCTSPPEEVGTEVGTVRVVPCDEAHTQEVFAIIHYTDEEGERAEPRTDFPGDEVLDAFAQAACLDPFTEYFEVDYVDSALFMTWLVPSVRSWDERDDFDVVCIAQTTGEPVTESLAGTGR